METHFCFSPLTKQSILDHVYVKDYYTIRELSLVWPVFGDHAVVMFNLSHEKEREESTIRRDWRGYSPELLCTKLHQLDWEFKSDSVQDFWNEFENQLINLVDEIVPLVSFNNNCVTIN